MTAGTTSVTIGKADGRLLRVTRNGTAVSLANGPAPAVGTATLTRFSHRPDGAAHVVRADYTGDLTSVSWRLSPSGWLRMEYRYHRTGPHDFLGVNLDYPESKVTGVTWLGHGPYRVWKNRLRGVHHGVWSKDYNDTATGAAIWQYPEFKGYHAGVCWVVLRTTEGAITVVAEQDDLFLRLFTPRVGPDPRNTAPPFPAGGISLLDAIPPIGYKFAPAAQLGPEGEPTTATGDYHRTVHFLFGP